MSLLAATAGHRTDRTAWGRDGPQGSTEKALLWGGLDDQGFSNETWEWDGEGWVHVGDTGHRTRTAVALAAFILAVVVASS
jgi:hypothetical protein